MNRDEDTTTPEGRAAYLDKMNNPVLSESRLKLIQNINDLYDSGSPIWTREMIRHVESEMAEDPLPDTIMTRNMAEVQRSQHVPKDLLEMSQDDEKSSQNRERFMSIDPISIQSIVERAKDELWPLEGGLDDDTNKMIRPGLTFCTTEKNPDYLDYARLRTEWDSVWKNWIESGDCKLLTSIFHDAPGFKKLATKLVCFGLGQLGPLDEEDMNECWGELAECDGLPRRRCMTQHAAALTIASALRERLGSEPLRVFTQEPQYSEAEKKLLSELGFEVVGGYGTLAFTHVDEESVVFTSCPNVPVKQVVADIARPAALFWNTVKPEPTTPPQWCWRECDDGEHILVTPHSTDPDSSRVRKLVEGYDEHDCPASRERFGDLKIYIRRD